MTGLISLDNSTSCAARTAAATFLMLATGFFAACSGGEIPPPTEYRWWGGGNTPASLQLSTSSVSLAAIGSSEQINATVRNASGGAIAGTSVSWSSADITVADVAGSGTTAVVTASRAWPHHGARADRRFCAGHRHSCARGAGSVADTRHRHAARRRSTLIRRHPRRRSGAVAAVRWSSENPGVLTVSSSGVATGISPGTAVVRVTAIADSRVTAAALLTVTPARHVRINAAPTTLWIGDDVSLNAIIDVDSTQSRDAVEQQPAVGGLHFRIRRRDGAWCGDHDAAPDRGCRSSLAGLGSSRRASGPCGGGLPASVSLGAGETRTLAAQVTIEAGMSTTVTWRSSDPAVAMISQSGMVTGVSQGSTTITAVSLADTTRRGSATISVVPIVRDLDLSPTALSMFLADSRPLQATLSADPGASQAIIWRTSNASVASVSDEGMVTANAVGTAIITALSAADSTRRATALITVRYAPVVTVSPTNVSLEVGQTRQASASVQADAGVNRTVTWRSKIRALPRCPRRVSSVPSPLDRPPSPPCR